MKKILLIIALPFCMLLGQDEGQLPGWGVYVGGGMVGASGDSLTGDGVTVSSVLALPNIGVSKGVMLGGMPLMVGVGIHQRGYNLEVQDFLESSATINFVDVWAMMPYPVGPGTVNVGFLAGTFVSGKTNTKITFMGQTAEEEADIESDAFDLDYGIMAGYALPLGPVAVNMGYSYGLADHSGVSFNGLFFNVGYSF